MNIYKNTLVAVMVLFGAFAVEAVDITGDFKDSRIAIDVENKTNATHILSYVVDGTLLSIARINNAIVSTGINTPNTDFNIPVYIGKENGFHYTPPTIQIKQDVITYNSVPGKGITITVDNKDQPFVRIHITIS